MTPTSKAVQRKTAIGPDDIVAIVILLGCFVLIGAGKDQQGILTHILEVTVGLLLGRRTKAIQK